MRVGILTTFANFDRSYSLVGVVLEQCAMLKEQGVEFSLIVNDEDRVDKESVLSIDWLTPHVRMELPTGTKKPDVHDSDLYERTYDWLKEVVPTFDVIITHDVMFVDTEVTYNQAIRDIAPQFPGTTWVHWVHSAPDGRPARLVGPASLRYTTAPHSLYVYLNHEDRLRYAESIGTDVSKVKVCYNPYDAASFFGLEGTAAEFVRHHRLWDADLVQTYPICMTRAPDKGLEMLIHLFGGLKETGRKVKLVVVNSHCNADQHKALVDNYAAMAYRDWKLTEDELIWTSKWCEDWEYSVPHSVVKGLFGLSNIFFFPTKSENCSRVLQEASMAGCFVIGNRSFRPMYEFLDPSCPRHEFGRLGQRVDYHPDVKSWAFQVARATTPYLDHPMIRQKQHILRQVARETIWRDQFQPILEAAYQLREVVE